MREKVRFTQAFKLFWTNYFNFKDAHVEVSIDLPCYGI